MIADAVETESIYPTHECFDDVVGYLNALAETGMDPHYLNAVFTIVHGICLHPNGRPFSHAWVEMGGDVIQAGIHRGERIYFSMPRAVFRASARVYDETRYTLRDVIFLARKTGRPSGPWVPEYWALCNDVR
jgi:hypothetical protein